MRVTARDIARPIPRVLRFAVHIRIRDLLVEKATALGERADDFEFWTHTVVLIEQEGRAVGSLYGWDEPQEPLDPDENEESALAQAEHDRWYNSRAGDVAIPIEPSCLIGGETPLEEILKLFADPEERFYLVLTGHEISHVLTLLELTSAPVRMALFAKILDMEDSIQWVLLADANRHIERLRTCDPRAAERLERRAKTGHAILSPFGWRRSGVTAYDLIRCASLGQKWQMLVTDGICRDAITAIPPEHVASFFKRVGKLRDLIAHGLDIRLTNPAWEGGVPQDAYRCDELYGVFVTMTSIAEVLRQFREPE